MIEVNPDRLRGVGGDQPAGKRTVLELPWAEYWPRFEEIVCAPLLIYEDDPVRDREAELLSVHLDGETATGIAP